MRDTTDQDQKSNQSVSLSAEMSKPNEDEYSDIEERSHQKNEKKIKNGLEDTKKNVDHNDDAVIVRESTTDIDKQNNNNNDNDKIGNANTSSTDLKEETSPQHKQEMKTKQNEGINSKGDRKIRKFMNRIGLKKFAGVKRVTLKTGGRCITINYPEVFKSSSNSSTYVIIGNASMADIENSALAKAAQRVAQTEQLHKNTTKIQQRGRQQTNDDEKGDKIDDKDNKITETDNNTEQITSEGHDETENDDHTSEYLSEESIQMVMSQVACTKEKAIETLKKYKNVIDSIVALTDKS